MPFLGWQVGSLFISLLGAIVSNVTSHHDRIKENLHPRGTASLMIFYWPFSAQSNTSLCSYLTWPRPTTGTRMGHTPMHSRGKDQELLAKSLNDNHSCQGSAMTKGHIHGEETVEGETPPSGLLRGIPASLGLTTGLTVYQGATVVQQSYGRHCPKAACTLTTLITKRLVRQVQLL